jgi:tetratricopeptide (TPR) repeat protein
VKKLILFITLFLSLSSVAVAQLNTDRILNIGRNALYFEDYVLSIQYFNLVISAKPYLADPYYFRAVSKYYLEDNIGAIADCDRSLEIDPFLIGAYELRGICHQRQQKFDKAVFDFAKGLKYDHQNTNLMLNLGVSYMADGLPDEAIVQFDNAIAQKGSYMSAYLSRGAAYLAKGDTAQALEDYDKAITINPYNMYSFARRGQLYIQLEAYDKAKSDYDMALRLEPDNAGLHLARGVVRYHLNDLMGAIADYDMAIQFDRNNSAAYYNRAMLRGYIGDDNRAIEDYSIVLQLEPDNNFALLNRALLFVQTGNYYAAISDLSNIITQYPDFPVAYFARAEAKAALGDESGSAKDYGTAHMMQQDSREKNAKKEDMAKAIKNDGSDAKGTRAKGDKDIKSYKRIVFSDEEDEEKSEYDSAIRGKVQDKNVDVNLEGDFYYSYYEQNDALDRNAYFLKALDDYNRSERGQSLYLLNKNTSLTRSEINAEFIAIDALSSALDQRDDPYLYFSRAMHYSLVKNFADAIHDMNKALDLRPNDVMMLFARASVRQRMVDFIRSIVSEEVPVNSLDETNGMLDKKDNNRIIDYDLIVADYNRVIDEVPSFAYAWYNKGNVMTVLKNYKAAISDYTMAIECEPNLAEAYYNRGLNYIFLGDQEKGLKDLSKAGELGIYKAYNVMKRYGQ